MFYQQHFSSFFILLPVANQLLNSCRRCIALVSSRPHQGRTRYARHPSTAVDMDTMTTSPARRSRHARPRHSSPHSVPHSAGLSWSPLPLSLSQPLLLLLLLCLSLLASQCNASSPPSSWVPQLWNTPSTNKRHGNNGNDEENVGDMVVNLVNARNCRECVRTEHINLCYRLFSRLQHGPMPDDTVAQRWFGELFFGNPIDEKSLRCLRLAAGGTDIGPPPPHPPPPPPPPRPRPPPPSTPLKPFRTNLQPKVNLVTLRDNYEIVTKELIKSKPEPKPAMLTITVSFVSSESRGFPLDEFPAVPRSTIPSTPEPGDPYMPTTVSRLTIANCGRANCAAKLDVQSSKFLRRIIVVRAFRRIKKVPGFRSIYNTNTSKFKIVRRGDELFSVFIPFTQKYLNEILPILS